MVALRGQVMSGAGRASETLSRVLGLIIQLTDLGNLVPGTLNVALERPYQIKPGARVNVLTDDQLGPPFFLLQPCRVRGVRGCARGCILVPAVEPAAPHEVHLLEVVSNRHLRDALGLRDGDIVGVEVEGDREWWSRE